MSNAEFEAPENVPDGLYEGQVMEIVKREPNENSLTQKAYRRWEVDAYVNGKTVRMVKNTSIGFSKKTYARGFVEALLGRAVKDGEKVKLPLPMDCQIVVKFDPDSGFSRIVDIMGPKNPKNGKEEEGEAL